jgi:hypothetical protein
MKLNLVIYFKKFLTEIGQIYILNIKYEIYNNNNFLKIIFYDNILDVILNEKILKNAFNYIIRTNTGNYNPYHNFNHLLSTLTEVYDGSKFHNLDYKDYIELLIAAFFHDYDHKGIKMNDDVNIENSKLGIKMFFEDYFKKENNVYKYNDINIDLNNIYNLLDATRFPYILEEKKLNISQKIIRDADLFQCLKYNWIHQNIIGLSKELDMKLDDFMIQQRKFLENASFNSEWGINKYNREWNNVLLDFEKLENILK